MKVGEFDQVMIEQHFEFGEVLWPGNLQFKHVGKRDNARRDTIDKAVCGWDVTKCEFICACNVECTHPETEEVIEFSKEYRCEIVENK